MSSTETISIPGELVLEVQEKYQRDLIKLFETESLSVNKLDAIIHLAPYRHVYHTVAAPIHLEHKRIKIHPNGIHEKSIKHTSIIFEIIGFNFSRHEQIHERSYFTTNLQNILEAIED